MKRSEYLPYLRTLRRVPDDVILSVATRDMDLNQPNQCVCGWVLREALARMNGKSADSVQVPSGFSWDVIHPLAEQYGGTTSEWGAIYWGVVGYGSDLNGPANIERAFVERVMEAAL